MKTNFIGQAYLTKLAADNGIFDQLGQFWRNIKPEQRHMLIGGGLGALGGGIGSAMMGGSPFMGALAGGGLGALGGYGYNSYLKPAWERMRNGSKNGTMADNGMPRIDTSNSHMKPRKPGTDDIPLGHFIDGSLGKLYSDGYNSYVKPTWEGMLNGLNNNTMADDGINPDYNTKSAYSMNFDPD